MSLSLKCGYAKVRTTTKNLDCFGNVVIYDNLMLQQEYDNLNRLAAPILLPLQIKCVIWKYEMYNA